ncbi:MAG: threonine synthase [Gammaproteobacteria bacterium]|nr:threonine synthase [Gammaproteobacteria bacterium]
MKYQSTRNGCPHQSFEQVLLTGLAPDGGLFVPVSLPSFGIEEIQSWADLSYQDLALKVITPFVGGDIPAPALKKIIYDSYAEFHHSDIAPLAKLDENEYVLELFHGPTLAFKDFALQVLGRLLDYVLIQNGQRVAILGATSGDTGSAAIEGCRHSDQVDIFILHPLNRVSEVQRRQMTTVHDENVFNLAVDGDFDDCQRIVKAAFNDQAFLPTECRLAAVNSINWARIMMQTVYYFSSVLKLTRGKLKVSFSVPTGNFGDIYAGYLAKKMGLPIDQLIVATNANDILHRFIYQNVYSASKLKKTFSPSMDILVSSNFERFLFDLFDRDGEVLSHFMQQSLSGKLSVSDEQWESVREIFSSASVTDDQTCAIISEIFVKHKMLVDPHTAIGLEASRRCNNGNKYPMVTLATAHPAKFGEAVVAAGLKVPDLPGHLENLLEREERYQTLPNDLHAIQGFVARNLRFRSK